MEDWTQNAHIPTNIGPYQVLGPLGSGSFSIVRLCLDPQTKSYYAIKIVPKKRLIERGIESKFENEIRIVQQLRHPGVVQLIDLLQDEINYYLVMEYCSNGDLYSLITCGTAITPSTQSSNTTTTNSNDNNNQPNTNSIVYRHLSEAEAKIYFRQIIDTLIYVHKQGVAHRDLKPENILVDSYGRLKLSDFGLSRFVGVDGRAQTPCGSPCYAAPEIIRSGVDMSLAGSYSCYDGRKSDAWSCGVILYAMLTGCLPWTRYRNQVSLFQQIIDGDFAIPSHISVQAAFLIRMLMDVDPEQRFYLDDVLNSDWMKSTVPMLSPINHIDDKEKNNNNNNGSVAMIGHGFSTNDIPIFGKTYYINPTNGSSQVVYETSRGAVSLRTVDRFFNRDNTDDDDMLKQSIWRSTSASSRTIEGVMKAISTNKKIQIIQHFKKRNLSSAKTLPDASMMARKDDSTNTLTISSSSSVDSTAKIQNAPLSANNTSMDGWTASSASSSSNSALNSSISTPKGIQIYIDQEVITERDESNISKVISEDSLSEIQCCNSPTLDQKCHNSLPLSKTVDANIPCFPPTQFNSNPLASSKAFDINISNFSVSNSLASPKTFDTDMPNLPANQKSLASSKAVDYNMSNFPLNQNYQNSLASSKAFDTNVSNLPINQNSLASSKAFNTNVPNFPENHNSLASSKAFDTNISNLPISQNSLASSKAFNANVPNFPVNQNSLASSKAFNVNMSNFPVNPNYQNSLASSKAFDTNVSNLPINQNSLASSKAFNVNMSNFPVNQNSLASSKAVDYNTSNFPPNQNYQNSLASSKAFDTNISNFPVNQNSLASSKAAGSNMPNFPANQNHANSLASSKAFDTNISNFPVNQKFWFLPSSSQSTDFGSVSVQNPNASISATESYCAPVPISSEPNPLLKVSSGTSISRSASFNSHLSATGSDGGQNTKSFTSTKISQMQHHIPHPQCNQTVGVIKKASVIANQPVIVSPGAQRQIKPVSFIP